LRTFIVKSHPKGLQRHRRRAAVTMLAVALGACGGGDSEWTEQELPSRALTVSGLLYGEWPVSSMEFDNDAQWSSSWAQNTALWGYERPAPAVDFSRERVVGVSRGIGFGCQSLRIERVIEERERVRVEFLFRNPPFVCGQGSTTLAAFVAIQRMPKPAYYVELPGSSY
jgi:hypothetical protein